MFEKELHRLSPMLPPNIVFNVHLHDYTPACRRCAANKIEPIENHMSGSSQITRERDSRCIFTDYQTPVYVLADVGIKVFAVSEYYVNEDWNVIAFVERNESREPHAPLCVLTFFKAIAVIRCEQRSVLVVIGTPAQLL
jgi:hypothetical protein